MKQRKERNQRSRQAKPNKNKKNYSNREIDKFPLDKLDSEGSFVNDGTGVDNNNTKQHGENTSHGRNNGEIEEINGVKS